MTSEHTKDRKHNASTEKVITKFDINHFRKEPFVQLRNEGFNLIAFGGSAWNGGTKIVTAAVAFDADNKIATIELFKCGNPSSGSAIPVEVHGQRFEGVREFERHRQEYGLVLGIERRFLPVLVDSWDALEKLKEDLATNKFVRVPKIQDSYPGIIGPLNIEYAAEMVHEKSLADGHDEYAAQIASTYHLNGHRLRK